MILARLRALYLMWRYLSRAEPLDRAANENERW